MKKKKIVISVLCTVLVVGTVFFGGKALAAYYKEKAETTLYELKDPISVINEEYVRADMIIDYVYDVSDIEKNAGFYDYVFVAEVNEVRGVRYSDVWLSERLWLHSEPRTEYEITVKQNLKGNLKTDEPITLFKGEGVYLHHKMTNLYQGDMLPEEGHCYLFLAAANEQGELYTHGNYGNEYLCSIGELTSSENALAVIERYNRAVENMDESVRIGERYKCKYEAQ
ncbi:MAG: hypothetical protein IJW86_09040 [Clostridia bacterium]|nr:hypothetical protein [Clostridia bacterium]